MHQQRNTRIISPPVKLSGLLILLIALICTYTNLLLAQGISYSVEQVNVNGSIEYKFKFNNYHFMTLIDKNGEFILRPHPGCDVNGWGSSWYAQPFLSNATLKHTIINTVNANAQGIYIIASGKVSRNESSSYGTWGSTINLKYNPAGKKITGTGVYTISLEGQLTDATGDLNLYKIASNYLDNVPLLTGQIGDTGDMEAAKVVGDNFNFTWIPPNQPSHFPTDRTDFLSIDVIGKYNNVDTQTMCYARIEPAFKPSLKIVLTSQYSNVGIIFGGIYDELKKHLFWADNVGITPLIQKTSTQTEFAFDLEFESKAIIEETCTNLTQKISTQSGLASDVMSESKAIWNCIYLPIIMKSS